MGNHPGNGVDRDGLEESLAFNPFKRMRRYYENQAREVVPKPWWADSPLLGGQSGLKMVQVGSDGDAVAAIASASSRPVSEADIIAVKRQEERRKNLHAMVDVVSELDSSRKAYQLYLDERTLSAAGILSIEEGLDLPGLDVGSLRQYKKDRRAVADMWVRMRVAREVARAKESDMPAAAWPLLKLAELAIPTAGASLDELGYHLSEAELKARIKGIIQRGEHHPRFNPGVSRRDYMAQALQRNAVSLITDVALRAPGLKSAGQPFKAAAVQEVAQASRGGVRLTGRKVGSHLTDAKDQVLKNPVLRPTKRVLSVVRIMPRPSPSGG